MIRYVRIACADETQEAEVYRKLYGTPTPPAAVPEKLVKAPDLKRHPDLRRMDLPRAILHPLSAELGELEILIRRMQARLRVYQHLPENYAVLQVAQDFGTMVELGTFARATRELFGDMIGRLRLHRWCEPLSDELSLLAEFARAETDKQTAKVAAAAAKKTAKEESK